LCEASIHVNDHTIEGYSDKESYFPGETVYFMMHTNADDYGVEIIRHGWIDSVIYSESGITCQPQDYPGCAYRVGCGWNATWEFTIPLDAWSGMYSARFVDSFGDTFHLVFVVKGDPANPADIVVLASTNTWQAYNHWGGASFYDALDGGPPASTVSFDRPNHFATPNGEDDHLVGGELHILRWLEEKGYDYDLIADRDLHEGQALLQDYKALIISTHGEYWTREMIDGFIDYLHSGGNAAYLSGNGLYWRVTYDDRELEVQKYGADHVHDGLPGGKWRDLDVPESKILGVQYDERGYDTYAPFEVLKGNHWIFDGTGARDGQLIGQLSLNRGAASGHETDKITEYSPKNLVHLARGINPGGGGADMVYYDHEGGGGVFSAGSITFGGSLAVDPILSRMVQNVLDSFLTP